MKSITYPLTVQNGTLTFSENDRVAIEQIRSVLETRPHERIERPAYGTPSYVFNSVKDQYIIGSRIEAALVEQTNLENINVEANYSDSGLIQLKISFDFDSRTQSITLGLTP